MSGKWLNESEIIAPGIAADFPDGRRLGWEFSGVRVLEDLGENKCVSTNEPTKKKRGPRLLSPPASGPSSRRGINRWWSTRTRPRIWISDTLYGITALVVWTRQGWLIRTDLSIQFCLELRASRTYWYNLQIEMTRIAARFWDLRVKQLECYDTKFSSHPLALAAYGNTSVTYKDCIGVHPNE